MMKFLQEFRALVSSLKYLFSLFFIDIVIKIIHNNNKI